MLPWIHLVLFNSICNTQIEKDNKFTKLSSIGHYLFLKTT
jgi:hypothetical protein